MLVTRFFDMCSGGQSKTDYDVILIEGGEKEARKIFMKRLGLDPDNITCDCCGEDFDVTEIDMAELPTGLYLPGTLVIPKD